MPSPSRSRPSSAPHRRSANTGLAASWELAVGARALTLRWRTLNARRASIGERRPNATTPAPQPPAGRRYSELISPGALRGLQDIPFHDDGPLTRWLMAGAEIHPGSQTHVAVHRVEAVPAAPRVYCDVHEHTVPELNLILPTTQLTYEIVLGEERYEVQGPASIFIPAGLRHSANVRSGSGFFVAIVLGVQDYSAAFAPAA